MILAWIVALIGVGMLSGSVGADFSEDFKLPASDSQEAFDLLETKSRHSLATPRRSSARHRAESRVKEMEALRQAPSAHVSEVASPTRRRRASNARWYAAQRAAGDGLESEGWRRCGGQPIEEVRAEQEGGDSTFAIGLLAAVVVLLLTFGSLVAMGLPIVTALFALGVGLSVVTLGTHVFDTAEFAPQLAAMIGLGVGIDYALFILTRFRNGLDEGMESREAAIAAVDTAGRAVLFAGVTVIIA